MGFGRRRHRRHVDSNAARGQPLGDAWREPDSNVHSLVAVGRLAPGVSLDQARADVGRVGLQLEAEFPESNRGWGTTVVSLMDQTVGDVRPALLIMLGVGDSRWPC